MPVAFRTRDGKEPRPSHTRSSVPGRSSCHRRCGFAGRRVSRTGGSRCRCQIDCCRCQIDCVILPDDAPLSADREMARPRRPEADDRGGRGFRRRRPALPGGRQGVGRPATPSDMATRLRMSARVPRPSALRRDIPTGGRGPSDTPCPPGAPPPSIRLRGPGPLAARRRLHPGGLRPGRPRRLPGLRRRRRRRGGRRLRRGRGPRRPGRQEAAVLRSRGQRVAAGAAGAGADLGETHGRRTPSFGAGWWRRAGGSPAARVGRATRPGRGRRRRPARRRVRTAMKIRHHLG